MDKQPTISIIMGVYNCATTLSEAIDSILKQEFEDWELIMCDDGSKDETFKVAANYAKEYPHKIHVIKNETNLGLNKTLNICLNLTKGKYIARMDGDDISTPDRFRKQVNFLDTHPEYAIVSSHMITFDENGEWGRIVTLERPQIKDFPTQVPMFCHAPCMIRREAFFDVGGYTEDERLLRVEDYNLWYKFYAKGYKGYNIQEALYKMRDDQNAFHRRTVQARINGVYATYVGFRMLDFPMWTYRYFLKTAVLEIIKIIIPDKLYEYLHKKRLASR